MKCNIIFATIACVLSTTLASNVHKVEQAHSQVMSHINENMGGVRMMRGSSAHLECYNGFLPLINSLAIRAKDVSSGCVRSAEAKKDVQLSALQDARIIIAAQVQQITSSLVDCSKEDGLNYFKCLENNAETNRQLMEAIKKTSSQLVSTYADKAAQIDREEDTCLMDAIDTAKSESDQAFSDLKSCIKDGPVIQTQIDKEEDTNDQSTINPTVGDYE